LSSITVQWPLIVRGRFSPDGKTVLLVDGDPERKDAHKWGMSQRPYLVDVATGKRTPLPDFPENGMATGITWSPDGKHLAYTWQQLDHDMTY
jgi:Tol biopolymer transport system component